MPSSPGERYDFFLSRRGSVPRGGVEEPQVRAPGGVPSGPKMPQRKGPARRGAGVKGARVGLSRLPRQRLGPADVRSATTPLVTPFWSHSALRNCCERGKCVPAIFCVRVALAHDEPRSGLNNSERESTSGRSTNYGSGHLIRVFRDIERIVS